MARTKLTSRDTTTIVVVLVGMALVATAFLTPWWTRGITIDYEEPSANGDNEQPVRDTFDPGAEGLYLHYAPFSTPGSPGGVSTDGQREFATALMGITALLSALFISATVALGFLMRTGRIEENHNIRVRFGILAFIFGLGAVLITAFILPVAGPNPGWLYGDETGTSGEAVGAAEDEGLHQGRFANVGFFAAILAFVAYPAYLWANAANQRMEALSPTEKRAKAKQPAY